MSDPILLCTDLDRTALPNGSQPESPQARPLLRELTIQHDVTLVYVSGRDKGLLLEAIKQYAIPVPRYAIGDVGTTIYEVQGDRWDQWQSWSEEIGKDWHGETGADLQKLFSDQSELQLQEPQKQNIHKLSYYLSPQADRERIFPRMEQRLSAEGLGANLIWSVDETKGQGLLDVVPKSATKLHAIEFLMERKSYAAQRTVFAGDSGNDMAVLTSRVQAVLVNNAQEEVRQEAVLQSKANGNSAQLYAAHGGFLGMNGNYCAGVLEGLAHYIPETKEWMESITANL
jgi:sucrose-6F-phosphate phosphohydrolase